MGECLSKASQLLATIESTNWEIFDAIARLADDRQAVAQSIRSSIAQALQSDEHVTSLGPTLKEAQLKAVRLLTQSPPPPVPAVTPHPVKRYRRMFRSTTSVRLRMQPL